MKINEISSWLDSDKTQHLLNELYPSVFDGKNRILECLKSFANHFPNHSEVEIFSSSGRVELCGNHTDHQGGLVLGCAIHLDTLAIVSRNQDSSIHCLSHGYLPISINCDDITYQSNEQHSSQAIIRGCIALFSQHHPISGLNIYIHSMIPSGAGLSSSASFECLVLNIFNHYFAKNHPLSPLEIAKLAQKVENEYFGKPSGLLDQLCISYGGLNLLDFKDKTPVITSINDVECLHEHDMCVIKVPDHHEGLTFAYKSIVDDNALISKHYSVNRLIEVNESVFYNDFSKLTTLYSTRSVLRAHHFFSENQRVLISKTAIESKQFKDFLNQINMSGHSSFEYLDNVNHPISEKHHLALAIALAQRQLHELGAVRVHGGGFAGSILCFSPKSKTPSLRSVMMQQFGSDCFINCKVRAQGVLRLTL
jgi:galactokinase